jgi:hypothetical protein
MKKDLFSALTGRWKRKLPTFKSNFHPALTAFSAVAFLGIAFAISGCEAIDDFWIGYPMT